MATEILVIPDVLRRLAGESHPDVALSLALKTSPGSDLKEARLKNVRLSNKNMDCPFSRKIGMPERLLRPIRIQSRIARLLRWC
jgi:hypothetical protein